jgi:hypothetical protein
VRGIRRRNPAQSGGDGLCQHRASTGEVAVNTIRSLAKTIGWAVVIAVIILLALATAWAGYVVW